MTSDTKERGKILGHVIRTRSGDYLIDLRDNTVAGDMLEYGMFGEEEMRRLRGFINPESSVMIAGAHVGALAIPLSYHCKQLDAIEANPATFEMLAVNVRLNARDNIDLCYGAANDVGGGHIDFICNYANSGSSKRAPVIESKKYTIENPERIKVPTVKLDDVYGDEVYDLIHMDIEGSEYFAFKGMQKILANAKNLSVEFIYHHLTQVAGVTAAEWVAPLKAHFTEVIVPGRPWMILEQKDWERGLQALVDIEAQLTAIYFTKERPQWLKEGRKVPGA